MEKLKLKSAIFCLSSTGGRDNLVIYETFTAITKCIMDQLIQGNGKK